MLGYLREARSQHARGAFALGRDVLDLDELATQGNFLFDDGHLATRIGSQQRSLDTRDATTDHHDIREAFHGTRV